MRKKSVLLIDRSAELRDLLLTALSRHYAVDATGSFLHAESEARRSRHDAMVVDVAPAGATHEGLDFIRRLRCDGEATAVVAISGLQNAEIPSLAYEAGADSFVQKGLWTVRELRAVLLRLLTRATPVLPAQRRVDGILLPVEEFRFAGATIDPQNMIALFPSGGTRHLSPKEVGILHVFATRGGRLVRRTEILAEVWGPSASPMSKTLDTHLVRLRRAYEAGGLTLSQSLRVKPKVGWWVAEGQNR